jgi:ubiquinone/menaquinone biosynthesis C-methylase UbiE
MQPGFSVLDPYETEKLLQIGVKGKAVAQLACNNGRELLSIKNMGAERCVGFDIAEEFIKQAEELNQAAQLDCEFVVSNIYEIPEPGLSHTGESSFRLNPRLLLFVPPYFHR